MIPFARFTLLNVLLGLAIQSITAGPVLAQQVVAASHVETGPSSTLFIVTEIFQGQLPQPVETHEIAFVDGVFYDFPSDAEQPWTIFDLPQSKVVLIDRKHRQRVSVSTEDLIRLTAQADSTITDPVQRMRFGMDAEVQITGGNQFELTYDQTQYRVSASIPSEPKWAIQYGQFVDWACRLNIARPRGVPPFARMRINDTVAKQGLYPEHIEVELKRRIGEDANTVLVKLRSQTRLSSQINDQTRKRIDDTHSMRVLFKEIPWDEYEH